MSERQVHGPVAGTPEQPAHGEAAFLPDPTWPTVIYSHHEIFQGLTTLRQQTGWATNHDRTRIQHMTSYIEQNSRTQDIRDRLTVVGVFCQYINDEPGTYEGLEQALETIENPRLRVLAMAVRPGPNLLAYDAEQGSEEHVEPKNYQKTIDLFSELSAEDQIQLFVDYHTLAALRFIQPSRLQVPGRPTPVSHFMRYTLSPKAKDFVGIAMRCGANAVDPVV